MKLSSFFTPLLFLLALSLNAAAPSEQALLCPASAPLASLFVSQELAQALRANDKKAIRRLILFERSQAAEKGTLLFFNTEAQSLYLPIVKAAQAIHTWSTKKNSQFRWDQAKGIGVGIGGALGTEMAGFLIWDLFGNKYIKPIGLVAPFLSWLIGGIPLEEISHQLYQENAPSVLAIQGLQLAWLYQGGKKFFAARSAIKQTAAAKAGAESTLKFAQEMDLISMQK